MMPSDDVTDLREVVDAINKLCDTMKCPDHVTEDMAHSIDEELREARSDYTVDLVSNTSSYSYMYNIPEDWSSSVSYTESVYHETVQAEVCTTDWPEANKAVLTVSDAANLVEWSDPIVCDVRSRQSEIEPLVSDVLPSQGEWSEPVDGLAEEITWEGEAALNWEGAGSEAYYTASSEVSLMSEGEGAGGGVECVAGHVAAMRERFESLTRATTPAGSRDVSPSPDRA